MVPIIVCWLVSIVLIVRQPAGSWKAAVAGSIWLLLGGLLVLGLGWFWLWQTGALPYFMDIMLHWSLEYRSQVVNMFPDNPGLFFSHQFFPFNLASGIAVCLCGILLAQGLRSRALPVRETMLAAVFAGWLVQAGFIQHCQTYVLLPHIFLALGLVFGWKWPQWPAWVDYAVAVAVVAALLFYNPLFQLNRLALWPRCWSEGSSPALHDELALSKPINWVLGRHVLGRAHQRPARRERPLREAGRWKRCDRW